MIDPVIVLEIGRNKFSPLFVSYHAKAGPSASGYERLRGCIGTFSAQPLAAGLRQYAVVAALHDTRFAPVALAELPQLQVSVSLLTNFEDLPGGAWDDWDVGKHGIEITLDERYRATFLPEVAAEQGWDRAETLRHLLRKAGYGGKVDEAVLARVRVTRYQSAKADLAYAEYEQASS